MTPSLLLLLAHAATAFQPDDSVFIGQEPVRLRRTHLEAQHRLRGGAGWQRFVQGQGAGWQARFDERTGTPHRAWGAGIDLGLDPQADGDAVAAAVRDLFARYPGLIGVSPDQLGLGRAIYEPERDRWLLSFDRVVEGQAQLQQQPLSPQLQELARQGRPSVWRGGVQARIQHGALVMLGVDTYPEADAVDTQPTLSASQAEQIAIAEGPAPDALHDVDGAVLMVLPLDVPGGLEYHLAWVVRSVTGGPQSDGTVLPPGQWVSFVDAHDGTLLNVFNQVRYAAGTVYGTHDTRTVNGDYSTSVMPFIRVQTDSDADYADADGSFDIVGERPAVGLTGEYFDVNNQQGADGAMSWADGDATWDTASATQAEIDSYVFLGHVRSWLEEHEPSLSYVSDLLSSNVNLSSTCNAYYDGSVNFYVAGGGCNNTGRIADVNYHEWGHGLHAYAAGTWYVDGSVGEGVGDTTAFLQTGDNVVAPYFMTSGAGIRDVSPDRVYPDDWVGEVHYDGLIFAGAVWDLWGLMEETEDDAQPVLSDLFIGALRGNPDMETAYDEFVSADDDDADLSNGTPHQCEIIEAFSRHGLGPGGGASVLSMAHTPLENQAATASNYPVEAELVNLAPGCVDVALDTAAVHYSVDDGETWETADLVVSGDRVEGAIPEVSAGRVVLYYIEGVGDDGDSVTVPAGGDINPFSFYVGDLTELSCQDFDTDDGGYTHELISGTNQEGADDWTWGVPHGASDDPDDAYSGSRVWGNDLGGGNYNGDYQDSKHNRLTSQPIDVQGNDRVLVQFRRWLNVEDGYYDHARVLVNDQVAWENHATNSAIGDEHHQDEQWELHSMLVDMGDATDLTLAWEIESDAGLSFGGWTIDDVCVYAIGDVPTFTDDTGAADDTGAGSAQGTQAGDVTAGCGGCSTGGRGLGSLAITGLIGLALIRRRSGSQG